jgi:hypothetical protein
MSDLQTCPKCGGRMKFSRVKQRGNFIDKRRDCACGHVDRVLIRQEIAKIIEVTKKLSGSVRPRSPAPPQTKTRRNNKSKESKSC